MSTMRKLTVAIVVLLTAVCQADSAPRNRPSGDQLQPKQREAVDFASLAYRQGNPLAVLQSLSPLLAKMSDEQLEAVDGILSDRKIPPVGRLLGEARLSIERQNFQGRLPRVTTREAQLVLPEFERQLQALLKVTESHPVMKDPLPSPDDVEAFEQLLWDAHVLSNQLENAEFTADYMNRLATRSSKRRGKKDQDDPVDYAAIVQNLKDTQADLSEREIELRLDRLALAKQLLAKPELTKEKFLAAGAWWVDARLIEEFFQESKRAKRQVFGRDRLNEPGLLKQVASDAQEARELAGDLTLKSQLLFEGLHWWVRGRYGIGTEMWGLAKSAAAMHSFEAQMALYMPTEPPTPTDPTTVDSYSDYVPMYDRRHHYWWAWEDRTVSRGGFSRATKNQTSEKFEIATTQFW